jgi:hypothetical protein
MRAGFARLEDQEYHNTRRRLSISPSSPREPNPAMPHVVNARITVPKSRLFPMETVSVETELVNASDEILVALNASNHRATPTLVLTNATTGKINRYARRAKSDMAVVGTNVARGETFSSPVDLLATIDLPSPGTYDLQASFQWDGAEEPVLSPPVRVEVLACHPTGLWLYPFDRNFGPTQRCAWLNEPRPHGPCELWISTLAVALKPQVLSSHKVAMVPAATLPVLSVAPRCAAVATWAAWIEGEALRWVVMKGGDASAVVSTRLPGAGCTIIPPLLLDRDGSGPQPASALAVISEGGAAGGNLHVIRLSIGGEEGPRQTVPLQSSGLVWARSTFAPDGTRATFTLSHEENSCELAGGLWSGARRLQGMGPIASWGVRCLTADAVVARGGNIQGAVLGETTAQGNRRVLICPWSFDPAGWGQAGEPVEVAWPAGQRVANAILRVDETGTICALMTSDPQGGSWQLVRMDGSLAPLPPEFHPPMDIVFRRGTRAALLYTKPGCGLRFGKL